APFGVVRVTDDERGSARLAGDQSQVLHGLHAPGRRRALRGRQLRGVVAGLDPEASERVVECARQIRGLERVERLQRGAGLTLIQPLERSTAQPRGYRAGVPAEKAQSPDSRTPV